MVRAIRRTPPTPLPPLSPCAPLSVSLSLPSPLSLSRAPLSVPLSLRPSAPSPRKANPNSTQDEEKVRLKGEVHRLVAPRDQKYQSNFVEFRNNKIVYRRYAGLFFCVCVDANDNELAYLEAIHFFVEVLDAFFGNV